MALSNIVVGDGQATPVNRTFEVFTPQVATNPAVLLQKAGGITKLNERMELLQKRSGGGSAYRTDILVRLPRTTDVTLGVVDTAIIDIKVTIPDGFNQAMRDDIAAYAKNILTHATVQTAIKSVTSFA